ncbi:Rho GTPase [Tieghemostelium lacteum]|uniref:Rho GTPase n=1 Tax=Tieghemostelium lacteum TaxID=361077 RepID=A0A151ZF45_TIELA|nr:Rho GTPase [Tieghemostelium lacteum]|eukprot:KYQ92547.1 Rho GTPase [Tieghemostelium lacteum]
MQHIKCTVIGDGAVGKTSMLLSFTTNSMPNDGYQPTVFDNYSAMMMHNKKPYNLGLWDTAGQEEFDRLRSLSYPQTDVFLVCFSCINPSSYQNVFDKWYPEIKNFSADIPIVLVCTQVDLRTHQPILDRLSERNQVPSSYEQGLALSKKIGAFSYNECSALTQKGLHEVFEQVITAFSTPKKPLSKKELSKLKQLNNLKKPTNMTNHQINKKKISCNIM